jgi:hypothetical protein
MVQPPNIEVAINMRAHGYSCRSTYHRVWPIDKAAHLPLFKICGRTAIHAETHITESDSLTRQHIFHFQNMQAHGYSCRNTYHSTWLIFKTAKLTMLKYAGARLFEGQHIEWLICKWCKWCNFHIWWLQLLQLPYMVVATVATSQYRSCNKYAGARLFMQKHISQHLTHSQTSYTIQNMQVHSYSCRNTYHSIWLIFKTATHTILKYAGARLFEGQHIEWFICKWCNFYIWWLQLLQLPCMVVATVATSQYRSCNKYAGARLFMQKHISQSLTHSQTSYTIPNMQVHSYSCRNTYHSIWLIFKTATLTLLKYASARLFEGQHIEWFICKWCKWCNFHIWWLQLLQLPYMVVATVATSLYGGCNCCNFLIWWLQLLQPPNIEVAINMRAYGYSYRNTYHRVWLIHKHLTLFKICRCTAIHAETHITASDLFSRQQHIHYWNMRAHGYLRGNT